MMRDDDGFTTPARSEVTARDIKENVVDMLRLESVRLTKLADYIESGGDIQAKTTSWSDRDFLSEAPDFPDMEAVCKAINSYVRAAQESGPVVRVVPDHVALAKLVIGVCNEPTVVVGRRFEWIHGVEDCDWNVRYAVGSVVALRREHASLTDITQWTRGDGGRSSGDKPFAIVPIEHLRPE